MKIQSPWLGEITWEEGSDLYFPSGLPGFEQERRFLPVEIPAQRPLLYLQSIDHDAVCFLSMPVFTIDADFRLRLTDEERAALLLPQHGEPVIGEDVLCLALLMPCGHTVETNMNAPIVIHLASGRGIQRIPPDREQTLFRLEDDGHWHSAATPNAGALNAEDGMGSIEELASC